MTISEATTIPTLLAEMAALGEHPAIVDGDASISYADLPTRVGEVAKGYLAHGIVHGDRVGIWAPNRAEFVLAMLGAQSIGAAVVPLNTRYTGHEAAIILERSRSSALILADGFLGRSYADSLRKAASELDEVGPVFPGLPHLHTVVTLDGEGDAGVMSWQSFIADGEAIAQERFAQSVEAVGPNDIMDILFTSGTTGTPKGVLSAHRQTLGVARTWARGAHLSPSDRYAVVNPFFHGFGYKAGMITSLMAGTTIYPLAVFSVEQLLELVQDAGITVLPGVPTIFTTMLDHPRLREYDLSSLRFAIAGATAAPATLFHDMVHTLGFRTVAQAYGLTECVVATMSREGESLEHAAETTGPAIEGIDICIIDPDGNELGADTDGEILLRGDVVMLGYFEDQEATDAVLDAEGWFHTGDVGRLDEHGCLKITDRLKDMFIVGGFNVYPAEVENVLRKHPAVNESAVIGIDDARLGTVGRAYVMLLHNADPRPDTADLEAFCRTHLANFKVPREFVLVEDFPRNATGKILKTALRPDDTAK